MLYDDFPALLVEEDVRNVQLVGLVPLRANVRHEVLLYNTKQETWSVKLKSLLRLNILFKSTYKKMDRSKFPAAIVHYELKSKIDRSIFNQKCREIL